MFKKLMLVVTTAALGLSAVALPTAASAQRYGYGDGRYEQAYGDAYADGYNRAPRYNRDRGYDVGYDRRSGGYDYRDGGYAYRDNGYAYRDRGYAPRRCNDGTTGTIVGAIAGGLLGNTIAGRGDRSLGTILGAGGGALAGRAIGRSNNAGYCR